MKRNNIRMVGITIGVVAAVITVWTFSYVDDWSRDLTTNIAELSEDSTDPRLKPLLTGESPEQLADRIAGWVNAQSRWKLASRESEASQVKMELTRTTSLFRYVDDIRVTIESTDSGSRLSAVSKSRIGKGDLGQNPRNLKELLSGITDSSP